ncbi:MAG: nuclear transport factor 2 family protein [Tannerellaceae bacterium]|jgi:hypothetical protein|nr:nuclear transport factor 2 family protein [Tannerellaceae bacterium]
MKNTLILLLIMLSAIACGTTPSASSSPEEEAEAAVALLMKGIENADGEILDNLAAEELIYGHSSGKVQNKAEFIAEITSRSPFVYKNIRLTQQTLKVVGQTAIVRHTFEAETVNGETLGNLKIGNVLIWQLQGGEWKLLARQAYR